MMPENLENNNKGVGVNGNLRPATAGEVRNPLGRPLGSRNRSTIVKEWLEMAGLDENGSPLPNVDLITKAQIKKAAAGDTAAFNTLMDSGYGKLTEKSQVEMAATVSKITREVVDPKHDNPEHPDT